MDLLMWFGYIFFGFVLFILVSFYDKKYSFTKGQNIIFKVIYLLLLSGAFSYFGLGQFNRNIFIVIVFDFIFQMIYISYFLERDFFDKKYHRLKKFFIELGISFVINQSFINKVDSVFLSAYEFKIIIWIFLIIYIYKFLKENEKIEEVEESKANHISSESIVVNYAKLKLEYGNEIKMDNKTLLNILYAIMIFENNRRPKIFRKFDNLIFKITGEKKKLGIMQVMSKKFISDIESIEIVSKKLEKIYQKNKGIKKDLAIKILESYDKSNSFEINYIYSELKRFSDL